MTYTPTTDEVRDAATQCPDGIPADEFDRWFAAHDACTHPRSTGWAPALRHPPRR